MMKLFGGLTRKTSVRLGLAGTALVLLYLGCVTGGPGDSDGEARWLAGDHHIHSRFSVGWNRDNDPPTPIIGGDAIYPIPMNALMGRRFGLSWTVATDHGGPNHSKVNLERAYPELVLSRELVPEVVQFWGMEFNSPGADHSSLIIPHGPDEAQRLYELESGFDRQEAHPFDKTRDTEPRMIEAIQLMSGLERKPVLIANHPSRSASETGEYGAYDPAELRRWNDTAPEVAVGMAGAPGHQARTLNPDGTLNPESPRGSYGRYPTRGGFDPMTARLGGLWDSMLGEGRRWWITANSDSHVHYTEGGSDFWPGEYSKTYVFAEKSHAGILEGLRRGRIFVTTGDLLSELFVTARSKDQSAEIGGALEASAGASVEVTIRLRDPDTPNWHGDNPEVARVDLIVGSQTGRLPDPARDRNPTARVVRRFGPDDWSRQGEYRTMSHTLAGIDGNCYLRVRGTNTGEPEPEPDPRGEDPWKDLWFYSNPIFIEMRNGD